jgi:pimeloyl-ACP methyl ester carboxylesterase
MKHITLALFLLILVGCGGGAGDKTSPADPTFSLQCDLNLTFTPIGNPIVTTGTGTPDTTVIALHGKNGIASSATMGTLAADLNAQGYDVIRPYMPWADYNWTGSLCDAMAYINSLVEAETNAGKSVILLGHSLAGPIVLSYAALSNTTKPTAITVVAPGHFVGNSIKLDGKHASSIALAESLIAEGKGDDIATFQTYNGGDLQNITTTANIYLSYHSYKQFPDITTSIPLVNEPTLWLAALSDSLTTSAKTLGIIDTIPSGSNYDYREIAGDHFTVINNVTAELDPWYQNL